MYYSEPVRRSGYVLKLESGEVVALLRVTSNYALPMVVREGVVGLPAELAAGLYHAKVTYRVASNGASRFDVEVGTKVPNLAKEVARLEALGGAKPNLHRTRMPGVKGFIEKEALINAAAVESKNVTRRLAAALRAFV